MNAIQFTKGPRELPIRFFGINLRAAYLIPIEKAGIFSISGGFYYLSMLGNENFGFRNIFGPQLTPGFTWTSLSPDYVPSFYIKYALVNADLFPSGVTNREIGLGTSVLFKNLLIKRPWAFTIDYSNLFFEGSRVENDISASTLTFGFSFPF
jgi:hypothetical protein